jgi:ABC-type branched-subunit amino acid transport system ATPase component
MRILETINLTAGYKKARSVIRNINLVIEEGEFVGLFGTNGAGKSTIMKAIMGLLYQQEGKILYHTGNNKEPGDIITYSANRRSRIGIKYLTQDAQVFPNYTVKENLLFAVDFDKAIYTGRVDRILNIFADFKENSFLNKKGNELSGGERAKTAIAMVMMTEPRVLMLDEPSAGLSPNLVESLLKGIKQYKNDMGNGMAVILIEQQKLLDARNICDSIYLLKSGETVDLEGQTSIQKMKADALTDRDLEEFMLVKG